MDSVTSSLGFSFLKKLQHWQKVSMVVVFIFSAVTYSLLFLLFYSINGHGDEWDEVGTEKRSHFASLLIFNKREIEVQGIQAGSSKNFCAHGLIITGGTKCGNYSDTQGRVYVVDVVNNSPAQRASIRTGDEVVFINGKPAQKMTSAELKWSLDQEPATVLINRQGQEYTFSLKRDDPIYEKQIKYDPTRSSRAILFAVVIWFFINLLFLAPAQFLLKRITASPSRGVILFLFMPIFFALLLFMAGIIPMTNAFLTMGYTPVYTFLNIGPYDVFSFLIPGWVLVVVINIVVMKRSFLQQSLNQPIS